MRLSLKLLFFINVVSYLSLPEVVHECWPDNVDEKGQKVRNVSYTLAMTFPIGPKTAPTIEKQVRDTSFVHLFNYLLNNSFVYSFTLQARSQGGARAHHQGFEPHHTTQGGWAPSPSLSLSPIRRLLMILGYLKLLFVL